MFLVSSEKIVHDISGISTVGGGLFIEYIILGMAHFEENLIQQIKNQDQLIKTLKGRLASAEKQDDNMIKILDSLKMNDKTRKTELLETRTILQDSLKKSQELEQKTIEQIKKVERANKYADGLKLLLHEKDVMINELKYKVSLGEEAEKNKHLVDKLEMCNREKEAVYKANKILEENLEALNAAKLVTTNSLNCLISQFLLVVFSAVARLKQTPVTAK